MVLRDLGFVRWMVVMERTNDKHAISYGDGVFLKEMKGFFEQ